MVALGLLQNVALLVTLTVLQQLVLRVRAVSSLGYSILAGLLYGAVALAGMMMAVRVAPGIVFDGRSIIVAVGGFFGGPIVGAIAAAMAVAYRIHLGGAGTVMGVSVSVASAVLGVAFYYLRRRYPGLTTPLALWLFGLLVHVVMLSLTATLPDQAWREVLPEIAFPVLVLYPVATLLVARFILDGEERLETREALLESEERLRAIIEQTDQGISLGKPDNTVTLYNPAMERISGYTHEEIERIGWFEAVYPTPERQAEAIRLATEALEGGLPYVEVPIVRKDGEERWVSFANSPVTVRGETHNLSIITDITEQRRSEARMRELESIVSRSPAVALTWENTDGWPIRFVSESIRKFGYDPESLMRENALYSEMMHPDDAPRIAREIDGHLSAGIVEFDEEYRLRTLGGEYRWVAEHTWILPSSEGGTRLLQGVLLDIDRRKLAEIELERHRFNLEELVKERIEELSRVNRDLEIASKAKSQLLANMSHELRTPMNSIIGFSGILASGLAGPLNEEQQTQVEMINRSGNHLLRLINDILDLSKAEAGGVEVTCEPFDPCALMHEVAETMRPMAEEKALTLRVDDDTGCRLLESDPAKVRQILLNLVGNAVKFSPGGEVRMALRDGAAGGVVFEITDCGPGIPEDKHAQIFEAFAQIEPSGWGKPAGTGLGLTISQEYARLLGGEITVKSGPGTGATFILTLPNGPDS